MNISESPSIKIKLMNLQSKRHVVNKIELKLADSKTKRMEPMKIENISLPNKNIKKTYIPRKVTITYITNVRL